MKEQTVKVSGVHYQKIKALSDQTGTSLKETVNTLFAEGLDVAENAGKVIAKNPEALAKVQKDLAKMKEGQADILDRLEGVEVVVDELEGEEALEPGEVKPEKFEVKPPSVKREDVDGYEYHCVGCGAQLTGKPGTCPGCGEKLDWNHLQTTQEDEGKESTGGGVTPWLVGGFLLLLALAARGRAGGNNGTI
ncbi:unnamed protein product [marine sediment metagenome]|uniref:Uncharacterized protein n=2 Tax=marine sediment metagenome TaxID=412755 RepID=X1KH59_9ZZZZ